MEKWDGNTMNINATVKQLGPRKFSQLLGAHALSGCDTVSYPFGKGKQSVLKHLENDIRVLIRGLESLKQHSLTLSASVATFFTLL